MSDNPIHNHYSAADIERYHKGQMSLKERHAIEKAALDDPFLADALEGYQYTNTAAADILQLQERLTQKTESAKVIAMKGSLPKGSFAWWKAAAIIVLVGGAGLLTYQFAFNIRDKNIASEDTFFKKEKTESPATQQTIPEGTVANPDSNKKNDANNKAEYLNIQSNATTGNSGATINETKGSDVATSPGSFSDSTIKKGDIVYAPPAPAKVSAEETEKKTAVVANTKVNPNAGATKYFSNDTESVADKYIGLKNREDDLARRRSVVNGITTQRSQQSNFGNNLISYNFSGLVTDINNNPLPFANVTNLGDNVGTYADARGNFTLLSTDSVLYVQARSVGFEPRNFTLQQNNYRANQIALQDDRSQKDEIVSYKTKVDAEKLKERGSMKDETPEPADGWGNYDIYIANNLKTPDNIKQKKSGGEVEVSFEVDKNGTPVNIQITKSLNKECDAEAIRLIKEGPKWKRKARNGKATVTVSF